MPTGMSSASRTYYIPLSYASDISSASLIFDTGKRFVVPAKVVSSRPTQLERISMLRMKVLLLLAVTGITVLLAGCGGVGGAETSTSNAAGTTPSVDTTAPSTPTGLTAGPAGSTGANLSWNASTDNVGVTGYIRSEERRVGAEPST